MIKENEYGKVVDGKLIIKDGITKIERNAFSGKSLTSLEIPGSVTSIERSAFICNNLTSVEIPDSVTSIGTAAFEDNKLTSIIFSNMLMTIGNSAFYHNELTNIEIPDSVITIGDMAFKYNKLASVKLSSNIESIGKSAFENNKLTSIEIPNSVKSIGYAAFRYNKLKEVKLSNNVQNIGINAFDNIDIIYDGVKIDKELVKKYGCENVIKLYNLSKLISLDEVKMLSKNVLEVIPVNLESIKEYKRNYKKYEEICNKVNIKEEEEEAKDIFKMCFCLGLFKGYISVDELINIIKEYSKDEIHQMWTVVKLTSYKPKYKDLFLTLYKEHNLEYNGKNIAGRLYNSFEKINNYIIRKHEEEMSKKNSERIRLEKEVKDVSDVEKELANLKQNIKNITYEDICYYLKHNALDIREGNEALSSVANELAIHMEQEEFERLEDIYEESIGIDKNIPLTKDTSDENITYHWSKSDNPVNTILGYLVNCCAKLEAAGEDIMRQSMINPNIANLIIYDENKQVLGKATAYYNPNQKYILFNNAEMKVTSELKSSATRRKMYLDAILRAVNDVINEFKKQDITIEEVRMGMSRNDLEDAIKEAKLEIELLDLFNNYTYKEYAGDANGSEGQAILYKDSKKIEKSKFL